MEAKLLSPNLLKLLVAVSFSQAVSAMAATPTEQQLVMGPWQYGLYGAARGLPVGLAFQKGITATVVTFYPDHSLRVEIPCLNEGFIREHGEVVFRGTWSLRNDELSMTWMFRGASHSETSSAQM